MAPSVAVIGGGVIGVTSALAIQDALEEVEVTIVAAELTPGTTGDGAAGVWGPRSIDGTPQQDELRTNKRRPAPRVTGLSQRTSPRSICVAVPYYYPADHTANTCSASFKDQFKDGGRLNEWGRSTHDFIHRLWAEGDCPGIGIVSCYDVADGMSRPFWDVVPFSCSEMSDQDLSDQGHHGKKGYRYVTFYAEPSKMLPFLMEKFRTRGGKVIKSRVKSLDELSGYNVIVNCTGIGARELVGDEKVIPVRGQVVKVHAPDVKCAKFSFPSTYVIPNDELIVLGGTAQRGDWNLSVDEETTAAILGRCRDWISGLHQARVERVWVGLRPYREGGVRLETEHRLVSGRQVPVVHNYGHGGSGVTMFLGLRYTGG